MNSLPFENADAAFYTVGQVASLLSVQPAFLRRLDTEELVCPRRSDGGQRRYSRNEIDLIHRVTQLTGDGFTLAGIKRLLVLEAEVELLRAEVAALKRQQPRR